MKPTSSFHWKTSDITALIQKACPNVRVVVGPPGGDYDTQTITVVVKKDRNHLFLKGWTPHIEMKNPADVEVSALTLSDGLDSRGGLTTNDPEMVAAYCEIRKVLAAELLKTDVHIHNTHEDFF